MDDISDNVQTIGRSDVSGGGVDMRWDVQAQVAREGRPDSDPDFLVHDPLRPSTNVERCAAREVDGPDLVTQDHRIQGLAGMPTGDRYLARISRLSTASSATASWLVALPYSPASSRTCAKVSWGKLYVRLVLGLAVMRPVSTPVFETSITDVRLVSTLYGVRRA